LAKRNSHAGFYEEGGNINTPAVDEEMSVQHQLTRLGAAHGKTESVSDIVKTRLKDCEKIFSDLAGSSRGFFKILVKLAFKNAVKAFGFLLFTKLRTVFRYLGTRRGSVLTGHMRPTVNGTFVRITAVAF